MGENKFNIVNMNKNDSLFNYGMQPVVKSASEDKFVKGCYDIHYFQNHLQREGTDRCYYTLSFCYEVEKSNDTIYFA